MYNGKKSDEGVFDMKNMRTVIFLVLLVLVSGTMVYRGLILKNMDTSTMMFGLVFLLIGFANLFPNKKNSTGKNAKEVYKQALGEFIDGAFAQDKKAENKLYSALNAFGTGKSKAAAAKLEKLLPVCRNDTDRYAVTSILGMCYGNMGEYTRAIQEYNKAMVMKPNSTLSSNIGMCYQRQGDAEKALDAFEYAVELDPENANAYNNIATVYFADKNYETALEYAQKALDYKPNMPQALGACAICYALLGDQEMHQRYAQLAIGNGYSKRKIDTTIAALRVEE